MKPDMTLQELGSLLPKRMPEDVRLQKGDEVLVRFDRRDHLLSRATIVSIFDPVTGDEVKSTSPVSTGSIRMCVKVVVAGDEKTVRPLWPFQDHIFTYEWVNGWAGMEVAKPPSPKGQQNQTVSPRMRRLLKNKE